MTSPGRSSRRRQRSTRVVVAAALIVVGAAAVTAAVVADSWDALVVASLAAVVLGAASARIMHSELMVSRRFANADRAEQAQAYRELAEQRSGENIEYAADMQGRLARRDATVTRLEKRLADTAAELADARMSLEEEQSRAELAEREAARLGERVADAEERATSAIVRVAELEHEVDVLTAEWQAAQAAQQSAEEAASRRGVRKGA